MQQATWMSIDSWTDKEDVIYNGMLPAIKKKERMPFAAIWMGVGYHIEWNKSDVERQIL